MRKIGLLLCGLCLLAGCGAASGEVSTAEDSTPAQGWGIAETAQVEAQFNVESAQEVSALEESMPVPEPTPEPPTTLTELCPPGPQVLVDGTEIDSVILSDTTLVRREDLEAAVGRELTAPEERLQVAEAAQTADYAGGWLEFTGGEGETWVPIRATCQALEMEMLWDSEENTFYATTPVDREAIPQSVAVPVLMYHAVSDDLWGIEELFVSPADMEDQLRYLTENGYDPIFFSDLPHLSDYDKPVLLTFDDGYLDNYEELFPLLRQYGVKATLFTIAGVMGQEHYFTADQAREMAYSGLVDIQSHTWDHERLSELGYEAQQQELEQSKLALARATGKIPYALSYPEGKRNEDTLALMPDYYTFGIDMNGGTWYTGESWYKIDRIYVSRYTTLEEYRALLGE